MLNKKDKVEAMKPFPCASDDVIPLKFHLHSGIRDHEFQINNVQVPGDLSGVPGWPCDVRRNNRWCRVYLSFTRFPAEVEALAILSALDGETEREGRYIRMHSAYEAVVSPRDSDVSAIRHWLAHPVTQLTRPKVRESLLRRFGALSVNLKEYYHQKEFYRCIGQMLIEIDVAIYERVVCQWRHVIARPSSIPELKPTV